MNTKCFYLLAVSLFSSAAMAKVPDNAGEATAQCIFVEQQAKAVMMAHQYGIPISQFIGFESDYDAFQDMVREAYRSPALIDTRYRETIGDSFSEAQHAICLDHAERMFPYAKD